MGKLKWHIILALWLAFCGMASAEQFYVNESGWWREACAFNASGTPISAAVDAADAGDSIFVWNGSYSDNMDVDKRLTLEGEGADVVTVSAASGADHVFEVTADWVNISGFMVMGVTAIYYEAGIYLSNANHCNIFDNNVSNNDDGICLYYSSNNTLTGNNASVNTVLGSYGNIRLDQSNSNMLIGNTVSGNYEGIRLDHSSNNRLIDNTASDNGRGICLRYSNNNTLTDNTASDNSCSIFLYYSSNNTLTGNMMSGNNYNFGVYGDSLFHFIQNIDASNHVNGKPVYYWVDQQNKQVPCDAGFVGIVNSTNITVRDLVLTNNYDGVLLVYTDNSRIDNITASNNDNYGIFLRHSNNNTFTGNTASNNNYGIYMDRSSNNTLAGNTASYNDQSGIWLYYSRNNMLIGNNASDNGRCGIFLGGWRSNTGNTFSNTLTGNTASNNGRHGIWLSVSSGDILNSNTVLSNGYHGIYMSHSRYNTLIDNNATDNRIRGIYLDSSDGNDLIGNNASNSSYGIHIVWSWGNTLTGNTVSGNYEGIRIDQAGGNNHIYHNNFLSNRNVNAYDTRTNYWNSATIGNYWDDYTGNDSDHNGIGDELYLIPGGSNKDRYPLMEPWHEHEPPTHGDLNSDGILTPTDTAIALQMAVRGEYNTNADISGDNRVTSLDALMILQISAGSTEQSPEEKAYSHLYEQMDRYENGSTLRLIRSYVGTPTNPDDYMAWVYDNDLAVLALIDRGTPEDMSRAKILCDSLILCQNHDQDFNDGRIRDGYWANDLTDPTGENSSIKSPGTGTGNMAWTIIALLRYYDATGNITYLNASKLMGDWIHGNCYDTRGAGGYTGGYTDWEPQKLEWKSTEHNIDVHVAFMKLYESTNNSAWRERATHAKTFVESMWNESVGHFWTGTTDDGTTINRDVRPLDVNTWAVMALDDVNGSAINNWIENNCQTTCCGFEGFDFNCDRDGIWFEGTAQMCIGYQIGNETEKSDQFINELRRAQTSANNSNGKGIVAACHDNVSTGFGWSYPNALHIGATAWYIFAERELNPYWGICTGEPISADAE